MRPILLPLLLLALAVPGAHALDNQRSGFVIGLGLGWGSARQTLEASGGGVDFSASTDTGGLATDFRLGGGLSEKWLLYFTNQQVFFGLNDDSYAQGLTGVGATHFFRPQAPSVLLDLGLGAGVLWNADQDESESGLGLLVGVGYEFSRHFLVKADWYYADVGKGEVFGTDVTASIGTFRVTLNWLGY
jgi:opacity protein-like surface antigen